MKEYYIESGGGIKSESGVDFFYQELSFPRPGVVAHLHPAIEVLFFRTGHFRVLLEENEYRLAPGDILLIRSNTLHRIYPLDTGNTGYYVLKIHPSLLFDFSSPKSGGRYAAFFSVGREGKCLWKKDEATESGMDRQLTRLISCIPRSDEERELERKTAVAELLLGFLGTTGENAARTDDPGISRAVTRQIYHAIVYINGHYTENITARDCAKHAGMSDSYFSRNFRLVTSKSYRRYLTVLRVTRAEKELLLSEEDETVISGLCGFENLSYFISVFKKQTGLTPSAYRAAHRKKQ